MRFTVFGETKDGRYKVLARGLSLTEAFEMVIEYQDGTGRSTVIGADGQRSVTVEIANTSWREKK